MQDIYNYIPETDHVYGKRNATSYAESFVLLH